MHKSSKPQAKPRALVERREFLGGATGAPFLGAPTIEPSRKRLQTDGFDLGAEADARARRRGTWCDRLSGGHQRAEICMKVEAAGRVCESTFEEARKALSIDLA
jgi:hypothetical protein